MTRTLVKPTQYFFIKSYNFFQIFQRKNTNFVPNKALSMH